MAQTQVCNVAVLPAAQRVCRFNEVDGTTIGGDDKMIDTSRSMDESNLEESLNGYKEQLSQIGELLKSADELTKLELYDLEKDLKELITVTEESLFSLKKGKLLALLTEDDDSSSSSAILNSRVVQTHGETTHIMTTEDDDLEKTEDDDFVGIKCRVKYTQQWGSFQYHNAMVLGVEFTENDVEAEEGEKVQARVLFLNPIHKTMVPCKFFLDGKCNYTEEECRYSHGYLVDVDDLQEYEEPDFTKLTLGSECLAKHDDDGVWYRATVDDLHDEQVTISFITYSDVRTLDYHSVVPIERNEEHLSSSDSEDELETNTEMDERIVQLSYKSFSMSGPLGEWEEHTKGIGSKLMAKMGYVFGKGLGKDAQGRIEPVEIRVLPPGKSLDKIAELREKGLVKDPTTKQKSLKQQVAAETREVQRKKKENATFDLINRLSKKSSGAGTESSSSRDNTKFSIEDTYKSLKKSKGQQLDRGVRNKSNVSSRDKSSTSNINMQVFQNSEKVSSLRKKLIKQKEALARNPGNSTVSRTIKLNISATENELEELLNIDKALQSKVHMKNQTKKLSIF